MEGNDVFCGGTIITSKIILTAAHCKPNELTESIYVIVGEHSLLSSEDGVRHNITAWENHPDYGVQAEVDDDFAIIVLETPIELGDKAEVACLPKSGNDPLMKAGDMLTVSGWGTLSSGGLQPDALHGVNVPLITEEECKKAYGASSITSSMICAGDVANGGIDSCQGD